MIRVKAEKPFQVLYRLPDGTNVIVIMSGRGGMKTHEVSKFSAFSATVKEKRIVILRDEKETIRESILNEVLKRFDSANTNNVLGQIYERLETGIKDRRNDNMVVFTKGFRASSKQKTANLKGVSDIDIAIVEEAEDIRDASKFNVFADSIRKEGAVIIIILNTPDIGHWILKRFFTLVHIARADVPELKHVSDKDLSGYFRPVPKKLDGFLCIQTSYELNTHLPDHIKFKYRSYGDPASENYDLHYYLTAIKGFASSGRKGQVLTKVRPISLAEYLKLPYKEYYGQDFGTARPAGMVGVKKHRNNCWCRQLNYLPKPTLDIGKQYCTMKINPVNDPIVCDSADKKACDKLENGWTLDELAPDEFAKYPNLRNGFYIIRASKGTDSVTYGIDKMTELNLFAVTESEDLWNEIYNYVYEQDKFGNYTNQPAKGFDHLIDPWRYVINWLEQLESGGGMERTN